MCITITLELLNGVLDTSERVLLEYAWVCVVFMACELELTPTLMMASRELTLSKRLSSFRGNYKASSPREASFLLRKWNSIPKLYGICQQASGRPIRFNICPQLKSTLRLLEFNGMFSKITSSCLYPFPHHLKPWPSVASCRRSPKPLTFWDGSQPLTSNLVSGWVIPLLFAASYEYLNTTAKTFLMKFVQTVGMGEMLSAHSFSHINHKLLVTSPVQPSTRPAATRFSQCHSLAARLRSTIHAAVSFTML